MNLSKYEIEQDISNKIHFVECSTKDFANHFHKKYEFYYIKSGTFKIGIKNKVYTFEKDDIVFIPEFYSHYGFSDSIGTQFVFIPPHNLTSDICALLKDKTLPCDMKNKLFNRKIILPIFNAMKKEVYLNKNIISKGYINILFGNLYYEYNSVEIEKGDNIELIVNILKYIDENFNKTLNLNILSMVFGYNKFYFSRQFNKIVRMNINQYINFVRLQKFISNYSSDNQAKITELAFDCGFDSLTTFYRTFERVYNVKPKQYLKL